MINIAPSRNNTFISKHSTTFLSMPTIAVWHATNNGQNSSLDCTLLSLLSTFIHSFFVCIFSQIWMFATERKNRAIASRIRREWTILNCSLYLEKCMPCLFVYHFIWFTSSYCGFIAVATNSAMAWHYQLSIILWWNE